jgi:hypothetical protein
MLKRFFSKIDLRKGYHHIPVIPEDVQKIVIATTFGLFEYKRMPLLASETRGHPSSGTWTALQRQKAENFKQIFPEKEYRGLSPNFHIHVSVSELYFPSIGSAFSVGGNMWTDPGNI